MKHIFDYGKKIRSAIIFGKGPSFDPMVMAQAKMTGNIYSIAINQTVIELLKLGYESDMLVANDIEPVLNVRDYIYKNHVKTANNMIVVIPSFPHFDEKPKDNHFEDVVNHNIFQNIFRYDLWTGPRQIFHQHPIFCVVSSYITALLIAIQMGAKTIYTNGIDGGRERHDVFKTTKQINPPNYDAQFQSENKIMNESGVKIIRVKEKWAVLEEIKPPK